LRKLAWLLIVLLAISSPAAACTSFAVYSDMPWYGMNFDYYSTTPFLVSIVQEDGIGLFFMAYLSGNRYVPTVGINEAGLFASTQLLYHNETIVDIDPGDDSLYMYQLFVDSLVGLDQVSQVREIAATRQIVDAYPYRPTHNLFADPTGEAIVVEAIGGKTTVTEVEDGFLIMTNFPNGRFAGKSCDEVKGIGADRYITAHDAISQAKDSFGLQEALAVLHDTAQPHSAMCPTLCSLVFDPSGRYVYVVIYQDFERIWRVSLEEEIIETYSGFSEHVSLPLGQDAISSSELIKYR
jgi:hypothetical protein